ncbi:MAG: Uma2 family endonuclease [Isosphaeraceae bacterium]
MAILVHDPEIQARLLAEREASEGSRYDEVWDGVYVLPPLPNNEHQELASELWLVFRNVLKARGGGVAYNGLNVSDREEGWRQNYREPDVAVILPDNPGRDCDTHWFGGPDLVVEILSPNDPARDKRPFYAAVGVRELLVVDRDPWRLELYRLDPDLVRLEPAGTSDPSSGKKLASEVLPLAFRLLPGPTRPRIEVLETGGGGSWVV